MGWKRLQVRGSEGQAGGEMHRDSSCRAPDQTTVEEMVVLTGVRGREEMGGKRGHWKREGGERCSREPRGR
jgi:hypothetical protein